MKINKTITHAGRLLMMFAVAAVVACTPEANPEQSGDQTGDENGGNGNEDGSEVVVPPTTGSTVETYQYPIAQNPPKVSFTDPTVILPSDLYTVMVEGQEQFVLKTGATLEAIKGANSSFSNTKGVDQPHICAFGCSGMVQVEISLKTSSVSSYEVMPVSKKPTALKDNGKLMLFMKPYDRYIVKLNGNEKNILMIFANPLQSEMGVAENDPNVIRYKAGKVYNDVAIFPRNGQTVFIEGGAIVYGRIEASSISCHVNGPGIIYSYPEHNSKGVYLYRCHDCTLKNTIVLNKSAWATAICESTNVQVDNWHAISTCNPYDNWGVNNDTCDIFGSNTVTITRGFSYSHDDAFCIKSHKFNWKGKVYNVSYDDCISYAVDGGKGIDLGYLLNEDVSTISYKNIYICRSNGTRGEMRRGGIALHNAAAGTVDGVTYENIYVEDPREFGFHLAILDSGYSIGNDENNKEMYWTKPGKVKNVKIKNLHILKTPPYGFYISGYNKSPYQNDPNTKFNVEIDGLYVGGKRISSLDEFKKLQNVTVTHANVTFK